MSLKSLDFSLSNEHRRKTKQTRVGSLRSIEPTKAQMTAKGIAIHTLRESLKSYEYSDTIIKNFIDEASGLSQLRYMNMKCLAAVFYMLDNLNTKEHIGKDIFDDGNEIFQIVLSHIHSPEKSDGKKKPKHNTIIDIKAVLLSYITLITNRRNSNETQEVFEGIDDIPNIEMKKEKEIDMDGDDDDDE